MNHYYLVEWKRDDLEWRPATVENSDGRVALFDSYEASNRFMKERMDKLTGNHYRQRAIVITDRE